MPVPTPPGEYAIIRVDVPHGERRDEQLGSKPKFWFSGPDDADFLFKRGRENEDWSEKAASECGGLLGIPCAAVELAECEGKFGVVSRSFLDRRSDRLVHGNELLLSVDATYPTAAQYHVHEHTIDAAVAALERVRAQRWPELSGFPEDFDGVDLFVGYVIYDAWIGNSDRHHENWAVVQRGASQLVAPSYDHGSSLGRNDPVEKAKARVRGNDPTLTVARYADKCRSAFYRIRTDARPMFSVDAAVVAAARRPNAARFWKARLAEVREDEVATIFERIPGSRLPQPYRELAQRLLRYNRERLMTLLP